LPRWQGCGLRRYELCAALGAVRLTETLVLFSAVVALSQVGSPPQLLSGTIAKALEMSKGRVIVNCLTT
jgi:hypothetical protein